MHRALFLILIMVCLTCVRCEYQPIVLPEVELPSEVSFSQHIEPIFKQQSCTNCHPAMSNPDLSTGNAYESLQSDPTYIRVDAPEESVLYTKPNPGGDHPKKYTNQQAALVLQWINEGAENN